MHAVQIDLLQIALQIVLIYLIGGWDIGIFKYYMGKGLLEFTLAIKTGRSPAAFHRTPECCSRQARGRHVAESPTRRHCYRRGHAPARIV